MVGRWLAAAAAFVIALTLGGARARAADDELAVALLLDPPGRAEIGRELLVALAERHARVIAGDAPGGDTPLVRAAVAQRKARGMGAQLALWVEPGSRGSELHAVLVDGTELRRAPLPGQIEALEPRVVATVAASLVDELWGGPAQPTLTVRISVEEPTRAPEPPEGEDEPPGTAPPPAPAPTPGVVAAASSPGAWELSGGGAFQVSGLASLEARLVWRAPAGLGVGAWATFGHVIADARWTTGAFGVELTRSLGTRLRFDYSVMGGFAVNAKQTLHGGVTPDMETTPGNINAQGLAAGGNAMLLGGRLGLTVPLTDDLALRLDLTGAAVASSVNGPALLSWISLLAEWRL